MIQCDIFHRSAFTVSFYSGHPITDIYQWISFLVHDILIPFFLVITIVQIQGYYPRYGSYIHQYLGQCLCIGVITPLWITGMILSMYTPYGSFFQCYGLSLATLTLDVYISGHHDRESQRIIYMRRLIRWMHVWSAYAIFNVTVTCREGMNQKTKELIMVTMPLSVLHGFLFICHEGRHGLKAHILTYSGWMGTFFTISYWFSGVSDMYRQWFQQLPLIWLVFYSVQRIQKKIKNYVSNGF